MLPAVFKGLLVGDAQPRRAGVLTREVARPAVGVRGTACCAGVLAAVRDNAIQIAGVTSSVEVMPLRCARKVTQLDPETGESFSAIRGDTFAMVLCIYYAIDKGADIINISSQGKISGSFSQTSDQ